MQPCDVPSVRHDAASLLRFVETIVAACSLQSDYPAYLESSEDFFQCIRKLGDATIEFLNVFPMGLPNKPALHIDYRRKLTTLRESWFTLHEFVKPAVEAHTLGIPSPFVEALLSRFTQIPNFRDSRFALIHTHEVMYYQLRTSWIGDRIEKLASRVGVASPFPPNLGIIALPYSQSNTLFLNCAIAHEMGHFAFEKLQMRSRFSPEVVASVETQLGSDLATILPDDVSWIIGTVLNWLEELFCDLFAIWLIGPCFSFSYIELFDLGYVLPPAPGGNALQFYDEHPADVLRLQQHRIMLEHLGWWNGFSTISSQHILLLNQCSSLKKNDFEIVGPRLPPIKDAARDTFFDVIPVVHSEVHSLFSKIDSGVREFNELAGVVEQYLWRGVVPSSVFHENRLLLMHPSATTLLNAAARVHISSMDELLERVADADPLLPKDRAHWTSRLELWTMKALEDSVIFERTGQGWR